jgi:predicted Na+-dependent transporter
MDYKEHLELARFDGIVLAICMTIIAVVSNKFILALTIIGAAIIGARFFFYASTAISIKLEGKTRTVFQIIISLVGPAILSLYFIKDAPELTLSGMIKPLLNWWTFFPLAIIAYASWAAEMVLDREYPFRGFLIGAAIIFAILFLKYNGVVLSSDDRYGDDGAGFDSVAAKNLALTGETFARFLLYVTTSYFAMLIGFRKRKYRSRISNGK